MIRDPVLVNDWFVVARSSDLPVGGVLRARVLGEDLVVWRASSGSVMAWQDLCIHRGARLSLGWVKGDNLGKPRPFRAGMKAYIPPKPYLSDDDS